MVSLVNPLTYLVTGIGSFAIGGDFQSIGIQYTTSGMPLLFAFLVLVLFAVIMFLLAFWRFRKAVVT